MVLSDLCAGQGWQNAFVSLECTQGAAGHLSRYCIRNHMGICRYYWTRDTNFGWRVYGGLCTPQPKFGWDRHDVCYLRTE